MLNEKKTNSLSIKDSNELLCKDAATSTGPTGTSRIKLDDGETSTNSTKNKSGYLSDSVSTVRDFFNAFKCEDDIAFRSEPVKDLEFKDKEPVFVIVDSSGISSPSSREIVVESRKGTVSKKHNNKNYVIPEGIPSTSRDVTNESTIAPHLDESDSANELQMIEINLQSDNEIPVNANEESDTESIVISYLQNKELNLDKVDSKLLFTKKKSSLLEDVPKMETIIEGEQFSSFPLKSPNQLPPEDKPDEPK